MALLLHGRATNIRRRWRRASFTFTVGDWPGGTEEITVPREQFDRAIREGNFIETIVPGGTTSFHLDDGTPVFAQEPPPNARWYRRAAHQA
jgi:hypothetical protein